MSQTKRSALVSLILVVSPVLAADSHPRIQTWVSPTYKTAAPEGKEIITIDHYHYREAVYEPPILIQPVPRQGARYDKPEYCFISRVSAMMSSNYAWWLETWDDNAKALTLRLDAEKGSTPDSWVRQWNQVFSGARMLLVRRIATGPYVVITYKLRSVDGSQTSELELPAVLSQKGDRWSSSLDLMQDPLLPASPWVSRKEFAEITVR